MMMMMTKVNDYDDFVGGPKEYLPVLRDFIGEDCLPTNYGGNMPALGDIHALVSE
jgi:hypothetical protein